TRLNTDLLEPLKPLKYLLVAPDPAIRLGCAHAFETTLLDFAPRPITQTIGPQVTQRPKRNLDSILLCEEQILGVRRPAETIRYFATHDTMGSLLLRLNNHRFISTRSKRNPNTVRRPCRPRTADYVSAA